MRWANSIPAIVVAAFANDLNPAIDAHRRLIARWSCSIMFVEIFVRPHFHVPPARMLTPQQPQRAPTRHMAIESHLARHARSSGRKCLAKERLGGSNPGRGEAGSRQSCPACRPLDKDSVHLALIEMYVSSTRHEVPTARENRVQRFSNSGTYRVTHRRIVECATLIPRSAIISTRSRYDSR